VQDGYWYVVDVDLEKYFDRVNHDKLMARVARHVADKRLLKLIRSFLQVGLMRDGVVHRREEGTPQGGPLSPLLANVYLDDLDKELEKRGHRFVRYADDCTIFVRSQRAGERVVVTVMDFLERKLKLRVNKEKTAVDHVSERTLLGYRLFPGRQFWDLPEEPQPF
jgi:group II intron reverse transcriptase/maturase